MEPIFENHCVYTRQLMLEVVKAAGGKLITGYCVVCMVLFGGFAAFYIPQRGFTATSALLVGVVLFMAVILFAQPRWSASLAYKRLRVTYPEDMAVDVAFTQEGFTVRNRASGGQASYPYSQVVRLRQTEHLLILMLPKRMTLPLDRTGFTRGRAEDFPAFLAERMA